MNLLYSLTTYPPSTGGAQIHQHQLARQLKDRHQIQVVSHWDDNRTDWLTGTTVAAPSEENDYVVDGVKVHRMGMCLCEKTFMAPFAAAYYPLMMVGYPPVRPIAAVIERHLRPFAEMSDIVHNVRIGREGISYASYKAARRNRIPFVLTPVHHPRWVGRKYSAFHHLYLMADALLALTDAEKEILIGLGAAGERVHVIGHGPVLEDHADPENFLKKHSIDGPVILFLGQHYTYKGYRELLKATAQVWEKEPEAHVVFIGPAVGPSEEVFREFTDPRIHRLGNVTLQEKTDALAACALLCVPSTQESFGGVYAEAWCFEKPVIGCNIPAVSEVITEGRDGFLVEQEPGPIAERILFLLGNDAVSRRMGKAGKEKVEAKYTWRRIAERVENVYNTLI
ncbi:MAG: glycosyltransferase family 4 protein [Candidatus Omnitrophota bacterium]